MSGVSDPVRQNSVSVLIPVYNGAKTLARAVRSALAQPETFQVIIIDDASTDETNKIAQAFRDESRVEYFRFQNNKGPSAARNKGLQHAKGTWAALLDADDYWLPDRVSKMLFAGEGYDLIADNLLLEDEKTPLLNFLHDAEGEVTRADYFRLNLPSRSGARCELSFVKPLMRRSFLEEHALRYNEQMRLGEDYDLYARAMLAGARMIFLPPQGYVYSISRQSLSARHKTEDLHKLYNCHKSFIKSELLTEREVGDLKKIKSSVDCRYQWQRLIDAVKEKKIVAALSCFIRPWPVPYYLLHHLYSELMRRLFRLS